LFAQNLEEVCRKYFKVVDENDEDFQSLRRSMSKEAL
jgi:hypothetical protein